MKKKTGIFLIIGIVLALMLTGCGKQSMETETAHTTEEDKLQIGLSFDSFVIERWLRDRDMFVSTAQSLGAGFFQGFTHQCSNHLIVDRNIQIRIYIGNDTVIADYTDSFAFCFFYHII